MCEYYECFIKAIFEMRSACFGELVTTMRTGLTACRTFCDTDTDLPCTYLAISVLVCCCVCRICAELAGLSPHCSTLFDFMIVGRSSPFLINLLALSPDCFISTCVTSCISSNQNTTSLPHRRSFTVVVNPVTRLRPDTNPR